MGGYRARHLHRGDQEARRLCRQARSETRGADEASWSVTASAEVLERLTHRFPSLLVDSVAEHEPGKRLVALKNVTVNEDFFQGHFPHKPLMPAVLMVEALTQAATLLLAPGSSACVRSEEHTSELQSQSNLVCRLLLEKKNEMNTQRMHAAK